MQVLKQLVIKKLYGKHYPVNNKNKFLIEHKKYFLKLLDEEIRYAEGTAFIVYRNMEKYVYPTHTIFGRPKIKNIIKNQQIRQSAANQAKPLQEIDIRLCEIRDKLIEDKNDEISIDDISFVYELQYKRRKYELMKTSLQLVSFTLLIIGLNLFF